MLSAGACLILQAESQHVPLIQAALDEYFAGQQAKSTPQATEANGLVDAILYGSLAQVSEGQAAAIRVRLVRRLTKPSTSVSVQNSLVEALVPLMSPEVAEETCKNFMQAMDKDSARRGSVLGMAAAVRAAGVGSVRKFGVIDWIKGSLGDKNASKRQAGLICLEALAGFVNVFISSQQLNELRAPVCGTPWTWLAVTIASASGTSQHHSHHPRRL